MQLQNKNHEKHRQREKSVEETVDDEFGLFQVERAITPDVRVKQYLRGGMNPSLRCAEAQRKQKLLEFGDMGQHRRAMLLALHNISILTESSDGLLQTINTKVVSTEFHEEDLQIRQPNIVSKQVGFVIRVQENAYMSMVSYLSSESFFQKFFQQIVNDDERKRKKFIRQLVEMTYFLKKQDDELQKSVAEKVCRTKRMETQRILWHLDELTSIYMIPVQAMTLEQFLSDDWIPDEILESASIDEIPEELLNILFEDEIELPVLSSQTSRGLRL